MKNGAEKRARKTGEKQEKQGHPFLERLHPRKTEKRKTATKNGATHFLNACIGPTAAKNICLLKRKSAFVIASVKLQAVRIMGVTFLAALAVRIMSGTFWQHRTFLADRLAKIFDAGITAITQPTPINSIREPKFLRLKTKSGIA